MARAFNLFAVRLSASISPPVKWGSQYPPCGPGEGVERSVGPQSPARGAEAREGDPKWSDSGSDTRLHGAGAGGPTYLSEPLFSHLQNGGDS